MNIFEQTCLQATEVTENTVCQVERIRMFHLPFGHLF